MKKPVVDLHCHTIASGHAYSTINENIEYAVKAKIKYLGISDHATKMPGSPNILYFRNLRTVPDKVRGISILKGIEANIIDYKGNIDIDDNLSERLDYIIASLHAQCIEPGNIEENTSAIIGSMEQEKVKIIGHPDDGKFLIDYRKIVEVSKETNTLLEINNSSLDPSGYRKNSYRNMIEILELCKEFKAKVILGSDSHICYSIGNFNYTLELLSEVNFPSELVVNYNEDDFISIFNLVNK